jgi:hypothetical protein
MTLQHIEGFDWCPADLDDFPPEGTVRTTLGWTTAQAAFETTQAQYGTGKAFSQKTGGFTTTSLNGCPGVLFNLAGALQAGHHVFVGFGYQPRLTARGGICEFANAVGNPIAGLGITALGYLQIFGPSGDSSFPSNPLTLATDNTHPLGLNQYYYIEVEFFVDTAADKDSNATCVFAVWVNNVQIFNYTGGLQTPSITSAFTGFSVTDFFLGGCDGNGTNNNWVYGGPQDFDNLYIIVGDSTAPNARLGTEPRVDSIYPTSESSVTGYARTGGTGASDAIGAGSCDGDTSYYEGPNVGNEALFDSTDTLNGVPTTIHGVGVTHITRKTGAGSRGVKPVLNDAATDFLGDEAALTTGYGRYESIWTVRPSSSAAWTKTTVEAAKLGVKITT